MQNFDQHFARVLPVVGADLPTRRVALLGCGPGAQLAALLAASGVVRWACDPADPALPALAAALAAQHGPLLSCAASLDGPLDLVLAVGAQPAAEALAARAACPLLRLAEPPLAGPASWPQGYMIQRLGADSFAAQDPFAAAAFARALLLRGGPHARPDLEALPDDGHAAPPAPPYRLPHDAPALSGRSAAVIGCGSLGSYVASELALVVRRLVLIDGGTVSPYNPARQRYPLARVGQPKASALAAELNLGGGWWVVGGGDRATTHHPPPTTLLAIDEQITDEAQMAALIAEQRPDLAVITTGTNADFALARALHAAGVPHIVARCYPRARFWEAIVVADRDAPCLGCLRGHLYVGPTPPPTPEEAAAYVAPGELVAEAATLVESGWAAHCIAELAVQLLAPPGLREGWFSTALAQGQSCFIGGAYAIGAAFGITRPGQVRAYGLAEIVGSAAERICADCGRSWAVRYRLDSE